MSGPDIREATGKVMGLVQAGVVLQVLGVAEKTGLLKSMAKAGPLTSKQIALKSGLQERYIVEILSALTAAGLIEHDIKAGTFLLTDNFANCLVNEENPFYLGGMLSLGPITSKVIPTLIDSVKNGGGVPFEAYGPEFICGLEKINAPLFKNLLIPKWLATFPGLIEKLQRGIRVADIGCGTGLAVIVMAKHFPKSQFFGFDLSQDSISRAKETAKAEGVSNATFECKNAVEFPYSPGFDLILTFDVIHDLAKPLEVLTLIFKALKSDGLYLMMEPKAGNSLEENLQNPLAGFLYSISTIHCMTTCLSQGGPGYGTLMGPKIAEDLCRQVGFKSFRPASIEDMASSFFEVHKEEPSSLIL